MEQDQKNKHLRRITKATYRHTQKDQSVFPMKFIPIVTNPKS